MLPYLDAALAFALTMLAVATLVTYFVRVFKNTLAVRQAGMEKMLREYFSTEFKPVVQRELNRLKKTVTGGVAAKLETALKDYDTSIHLADFKGFSDLATDELVEHLKRSSLGQKLLTELGNHTNAIFDELGKRYEIIGRKATESFRKNSSKWAFIFALAIALVLNVDSLYIAETYVNNASLAQAVIVQKDAFVQDYDRLADVLEKEQGRDDFTKEDLEAAFKDSQDQLKVVAGAGFPLGWSYFPHAFFLGKNGEWSKDPAQWGASQDFQNRNNLLGWVSWVVGVFLTGVLAGKGGPFWYDVVASISRVVQGTRAMAKKPESA